MNKLTHVTAVAFFSLWMAGCDAQPTNFAKVDGRSRVDVGKNISIRSKFEGLPVVEPHLSVHPTNNNHMLVTAMVVTDINYPYESCRLSSFVTTDGGESWTETAHDWWGYDPWSSILPDGNTVMTWLGTKGGFKNQFPLQIFFSSDGGISWAKDMQTFPGLGHGHDGTKVTSLNGDFYCTTVRFNAGMGANVVLYRKHGNGQFEEVAEIDGKGQRLNFCEPAILSDGTAIVPYAHYLEELWVKSYSEVTAQRANKSLVTLRSGGARGYPRMVADVNESSAFKNKLYLVRSLGSNGNYQGIWINHSSDRGKSWSKEIRIDLFEDSPPSRATVPSIAVNKDGVVAISWVDSQNDPEQELTDVYFSISSDGGESFQRPVRVTDRSTNPVTKQNGEVSSRFPGGGHYLGIAARPNGTFQLVWSDTRSGRFELQTCNIGIK